MMDRLLEQLPFAENGTGRAGHLLGVMVTGRALYGVLLERDDEGTRVVRRFSRQRGGDYGSANPDGSVALPDVDDEHSGEDFTLKFGEGAEDGDDLFLGSEFGAPDEGGGGFSVDTSPTPVPNFALELADILEECRDTGYDDLSVAFAAPSSSVMPVELPVPEAKPDDPDAPPPVVKKKKLLSLLEEHHDGPVSAERAAFVPMTSTEEGVPRYLALVGSTNDPVLTTLETVREQEVADLPARWLLDTELTLYLGLSRAVLRLLASPAEVRQSASGRPDPPNTLFVRVGADDTLVLFLRGETLHHIEQLRSLTAYDGPETICSRVLLLQDEYGIGDMDRVLLVGEEQEEELVDSFEMFFPDAQVESLREHLPGGREEGTSAPPSATVPATGAALRLTDHAGFQTFEDVNLIPKKLMRRRLKLPFSWHVPALCVVLFAVTMFFMGRYFSMEQEISQTRDQLQTFPDAELLEDPQMLQARIDSLQAVSDDYMRGLAVLDELLMGSDKWSQALAQITRETAAVRGAWVESWQPEESSVTLVGNATARDHVVNLAERVEGTIERVVFSEVRDWPVYSFTIGVPLEDELPEATKYLREQMSMATAEEESPLAGEEGVPALPASLENDD